MRNRCILLRGALESHMVNREDCIHCARLGPPGVLDGGQGVQPSQKPTLSPKLGLLGTGPNSCESLFKINDSVS